MTVRYQIAKQDNYLFFTESKAPGEGTSEIKIDIVQKKITQNKYLRGTKSTITYQDDEEEYKQIINNILEKTNLYLKESKIIEGYEKEHQIKVANYQECLKKLR